MDSPATKAKSVLETCLREKGWTVKSYLQDFAWIWDLDSSDGVSKWLADRRGEDANLLIVWDGMPEAQETDVLLLDCVTPLDWVLLYLLRSLECSNPPSIRVGILDRYSHHRPDAFSLTLMPALLHALPWVKVWRLFPEVSSAAHDFSTMVETIKVDDKWPKSDHQAGPTLRRLFGAWQGAFMQARDHHAVSNKLGPWLLIDRLANGEQRRRYQKSLHNRPALDALLSCCRSITGIGREAGSSEEKAQSTSHLSSIENVDLLLIDDQVRDGWDQAIALAAGLPLSTAFEWRTVSGPQEVVSSKSRRLVASPSPEFLVDTLKRADYKNRSFSTCVAPQGPDGAKHLDEIVLLDLRLFSLRPVEEEVTFYRSLLEIITENGLSSGEGALAWPGFTTKEIEEVTQWIADEKPERHGPKYDTVLSLLPRLLALASPSTPILLFSVAGRRTTIEKLRDYGNVITLLEKPRFSAEGLDVAISLFQERWREAIDRAAALLTGRRTMRRLMTHTMADVTSQPCCYIEVFIDEDYTNSNRSIYVGGCVAIFTGSSIQEAIQKADSFDKSLLDAGVRYYDSLYGPKPQNIVAKKDSCEDQLKAAINTNPSGLDVPTLVGFRLQKALQPNSGISPVARATDRDYREGLAANIELLVYETLPAAFGVERLDEGTFRFSFFVATKAAKIGKTGNPPPHNILRWQIGCDGLEIDEPNVFLLTTIERDSIFPIVTEIRRQRGGMPLGRAIGQSIRYEKEYDHARRNWKPARKPRYFICPTCKNPVDLDRYKTSLQYTGAIGIVRKTPNMMGRKCMIDSCTNSPPSWWTPGESLHCDDTQGARHGDRVRIVAATDRDGRFIARIAARLTSHELDLLDKRVVGECGCNVPYVADLRTLLYVADEILDKYPDNSLSPYHGVVQTAGAGGFDDVLDQGLLTLLEVSRLVQERDIVMGCIKAAGVVKDCDPNEQNTARHIILARLATKAQRLNGSDFIRVCDGIRTLSVSKA